MSAGQSSQKRGTPQKKRSPQLHGNVSRPKAVTPSAPKQPRRAPERAEAYIPLSHDKHAPDLHVLEKAIGYRFRHKDLLLRALTHTSYAHGQVVHGEPMQSNERLEFLGDRILSFAVDKYLFQKHPDLMEGDLTQMHSTAVANETLVQYASQINLCGHLRIARGTRVKGTKIPADAFEALIAAMYLDRQRMAHVEKFILRFVEPLVEQSRQEIDWQHLVRTVEKSTKNLKKQ